MSGKRSAARIKFLEDIVITAIEGGVNFWADVRDYNYSTPGSVSARIRDSESVGEWEVVNMDTIAKGLGLIRKNNDLVGDVYLGYIKTAESEKDAGIIDADTATAIVEVALFGEVVYG